ncbi:NUDIX domain-containing protein [Polaromonas sp.]|nr:NUDIX domain-containing protein [Candidatus Saccharibacteria bacterium]
MDEILDLVDENDSVIGTIKRSDYKNLLEQNLGYIRASELFIINDDSKIWIPVRTSTKTIAPNGYDYSAAGHVESGDDYTETIIRKTKEEINLDVTEDKLQLVAKMKSDDVRYFRSVYMLRSNVTPSLNPDDFISAEWLTPDEVIHNIDTGHPAKSSLRETILVLKDYLSST